MQQQNQPSSQTFHRQRKDSSTPQPAGNQHLYAKETRQPPPSHRTSAGKRPGCWPPWNCQELHRSPTTPLSHISQTINFPSAIPCTTPHYTHKAPAFLTHLWEHLRTEHQPSVSKPVTSCRPCAHSEPLPVPPRTGTIPWNQHLLSLIPELPQQQAQQVKLTWLHHTLLCSISW